MTLKEFILIKRFVLASIIFADLVFFLYLVSPGRTVQAETQPLERGIPIETDFSIETVSGISLPAAALISQSLPNFGSATIPTMTPFAQEDWKEYTATAYCLRGVTRTGTRTKLGTIAVDPDIIPFGSILEISSGKYSGVYYALDSGKKVKGNRVDVFIPSHRDAIIFGKRKVLLRLIRSGWGEDTPASIMQSLLRERNAEAHH